MITFDSKKISQAERRNHTKTGIQFVEIGLKPHPQRGRVVAVGRWVEPVRTPEELIALENLENERPRSIARPYFVAIEWFEGKEPVHQPVSELEFFNLLNKIMLGYEIILDVEVV